jgi:hypothetical protein
MWKTRIVYLCVLGLSWTSVVQAKVRFRSSELHGQTEQVLFADLDGDGLQDAVFISDPNLAVYFQQAKGGFTKQANLHLAWEERPTLLWPARMSGPGQSLLSMTAQGVQEWRFANRGNPPDRRQIIEQATILPDQVEKSYILQKRMSVQTPNNTPLLLIPVGKDLQVWRYQQTWQAIQTLKNAVSVQVMPAYQKLGYDRFVNLNMNIGDVNGDGLEDLMLCRSDWGKQCFSVFLQNAQGRFTEEPALLHACPEQQHTWTGWVDINQDGHVDLIQNTWLNEPWFIPGTRSGKVLVRIFEANAQGQLPKKPSSVFRKNDWIAAVPIVDIDGDGCTDLVLGYSLFDSREGIRKTALAKQLDFNLRFHFYRPGQGYAQTHDCQRDLLIHLDQHSFHMTWSRRSSFQRFINLSGDFDGDGDVDVLVRDHDKKVSAYPFISREKGFSRRACVQFNYVESVDWFDVKDLNGDGISDLISKAQARDVVKVFLSQN